MKRDLINEKDIDWEYCQMELSQKVQNIDLVGEKFKDEIVTKKLAVVEEEFKKQQEEAENKIGFIAFREHAAETQKSLCA